MYSSILPSTSELMEVRGQRHGRVALGNHSIGGWTGPMAGLDARPPPGFDPHTVHPVASRYTDLGGFPKPGIDKSRAPGRHSTKKYRKVIN
jgi:hypothetical protein